MNTMDPSTRSSGALNARGRDSATDPVVPATVFVTTYAVATVGLVVARCMTACSVAAARGSSPLSRPS